MKKLNHATIFKLDRLSLKRNPGQKHWTLYAPKTGKILSEQATPMLCIAIAIRRNVNPA